MEELAQGEQFIHCKITILETQLQFLATFIYARNHPDERVELWQYIEQLASTIQSPWVVLGDFNTTLLQKEECM